MKRGTEKTVAAVLFFFMLNIPPVFAAGPELSGVLDTAVNYKAGAGEAPPHSWGVEEFANLRLRIEAGERAVLNAAFNLIAVSGNNLQAAALASGYDSVPGPAPFVCGKNYAAALELERLYFRINGGYFDSEAGLLRMPFGYGNIWRSSDFLNPANPLFPDARYRGVLGADLSFYPGNDLKIMPFAASPADPLEAEGGGFIPGILFENHFDRFSAQALYAFQTPLPGTDSGLHRFGFSLKADFEIGLVADTLYTLDPDNPDGIEGLSAGAGFDYSFLGGDLYVLAEYLFNGLSSVSARQRGGNWSNHHYIYGSGLYRFNDYTSLALSAVFCFDDLSFSPFLTFGYEIFQGFSLNLTARFPFDEYTLSGGRAGELGPLSSGAKVIFKAAARLRF